MWKKLVFDFVWVYHQLTGPLIVTEAWLIFKNAINRLYIEHYKFDHGDVSIAILAVTIFELRLWESDVYSFSKTDYGLIRYD